MNQDVLVPALGSFKSITSSPSGISEGELAYSIDTKQLFTFDGYNFIPVTSSKSISVKDKNSTLCTFEEIIVVSNPTTHTLPKSTGMGKTYYIINDSESNVIIQSNPGDVIKNANSIIINKDQVVILIDYKPGSWVKLLFTQ